MRRPASASPASPQYTIDVLTDQAPTVSFAKPGRDTSASPIEEVFVEAQRRGRLRRARSRAGLLGERRRGEDRASCSTARNRLPEVTAGHTFYLEELGVQPGDSVSYYARAADNDAAAAPSGDERPLLPARPAVQQGLPPGAVAGRRRRRRRRRRRTRSRRSREQQRQIIAATFNVQRDRKTMTRRQAARELDRRRRCRSRGCASRSKACSRA